MNTDPVMLILTSIQTLVGILTLIALLWYAWETRRIRLDAAHQNELLRSQIELTQKMFSLEEEKETSAREPLFQWTGGGSDVTPNSYRCTFLNGGAAIEQVSAESEEGKPLEVTRALPKGGSGILSIALFPDRTPIKFKIQYQTNQMKRQTQFFSLRAGENPKRVALF